MAALAGLFAIGVGVLLTSGDSSKRDIPNYYFRAEGVEVRSSVDEGPDDLNVIKAWHLDDLWRWEFWQPQGEELVELTELVVDGDTLYSYDPRRNTYYSEKMPDAEAFSFLGSIGFIPAESIADFIALQAESDGYLGATEKDSTRTLLGRSVRAVEVEFRLGSPERELFDLRTTYWIEPETMLLLARDLESPGGRQRFEIVELKLGEPIDEESVAFKPPAGARLVDPPPYSAANRARVRDNDPDVPPGFLTPEHLPAGYELASRETKNLSNAEPTTLRLTFEAGTLQNGGIQEFEIEQT